MNRRFYATLFILFLLTLSTSVMAQSPAGSVDGTFGTNGVTVTSVNPFTDYIQAMALQTDGKIVAVGANGNSMGVVRYTASGLLDSSFNGSGMTDATAGDAYDVAIQPDGKIVVVGHNGNVSNTDTKVVRYNTNGTLDTTFDSDGMVSFPMGPATDEAWGVAIQADGKILIFGRRDTPPNFTTTYGVARLNADGSVDTSFGDAGVVVLPGNGPNFAHTLALQPDGKFIIAQALVPSGSFVQKLVLLRYTSSGALDESFGDMGSVTTQIGTGVEYPSLALQPDGKIVVSCSSFTNAASYDFSVARFTSSGALDATFGNAGVVTTPIGPGGTLDQAKALVIQANGKIVVGGRSPIGSDYDFVTVRYTRNGQLDPRWGNGGIVRTNLGAVADSINAMVIQRNGRVVVGGESDLGTAGRGNFALARYMGDPAENFDYDRDGSSDISVFRPTSGDWWTLGSSSGSANKFHWGLSGDELAPADYDGDLKVDFAVWRSGAIGTLYVLNSSDNSVRVESFGQTGDDPSIIGDYDGDGKADPAVYRAGASAGQPSFFYYRGSLNNPGGNITFVPWGMNGDVAARGDFNGDNRLDPTVFRNGAWHTLNLNNNSSTVTNWGIAGDRLVPADYTGDGKTDLAVFRNGVWYILESNSGLGQYVNWGLTTDTVVPADYDGDGRADIAVYRDGTWYTLQTTAGVQVTSFGLSTDIPTPSAYAP